MEKIEEVLTRSIDTIYPSRDAFKTLLIKGKKLRIYMGIDPTATYAHLGHSTNYIILKRLHELGHKIIVLIGDFTAMIGDPSDKNAARKALTKEEVEKNLKTFKRQIGKILDFNDKKNPIEFKFNSQWLAKLNFEDVVRLASNFTVQQMIERDVFEKRLKENKPLFLHEFFYPLMQGYDSVALEADVEIGGTDQTFNMLAGRTLVKTLQDREKIVISTTLLVNPVTGEKLMSKSLGTGIALDEPANEMYGKVMSLPDEAIIQCFIDCTYFSMERIDQFKKELKEGINPRNLKAQLAYEIVTMYHNEKAAKEAEENFDKIFRKKEMPSVVKTYDLLGEEIKLPALLVKVGFATSNSDARRKIEQNAVRINGKTIADVNYEIRAGESFDLNVGKLNFIKIKND